MTLAFLTTWAIKSSGSGITGLNCSVMWGPYIANLIYFIGIGHAGTFISAALRLMRMEFRRPIAALPRRSHCSAWRVRVCSRSSMSGASSQST